MVLVYNPKTLYLVKVTWVEHVEVDDRGTVHSFFKQYMNSGQALGAKRWVATLNHMAERLTLATSSITTLERSDLIRTFTNSPL